jgi:RAD51-like protein 2
MRWCSSSALSNGSSALSKLKQERRMHPISTGSLALDRCLGGNGICEGEVTEFSGGPASAKTQLAMQLCINAQLPSTSNVNSRSGAIFIDAEGAFMSERVSEMAEYAAPSSTSAHSMLRNIWLYRVHSAEELRGVVELLENSISAFNARIVVIDSIAFHMRHGITQSERQPVLQAIMHTLVKLAHDQKIAVVVVNQAVARLDTASTGPSDSGITAALGESFAHMCSTRILLGFSSFDRCAWLVKSPKHPKCSTSFAVTHAGIRDSRKRHQPDDAGDDPAESHHQPRDNPNARLHREEENDGFRAQQSQQAVQQAPLERVGDIEETVRNENCTSIVEDSQEGDQGIQN